jgi:hypothetical protein
VRIAAAHEIERLQRAASSQNDDVCQTLGKALGYPWFKDDQENFAGSTETHGVCVGDHVAETLAIEAAREIERLRAEVERMREAHAENARLLGLVGHDLQGRVDGGKLAAINQCAYRAFLAASPKR